MPIVVIVDDDIQSRLTVKSWLEAAGQLTAEAASAEEAVKLVESLDPDVVVADLSSPAVDGLGLIRTMRSLPTRARIIATSAEPNPGANLRAIARVLGAAATIRKPLVADQFMHVVHELLGANASQEQPDQELEELRELTRQLAEKTKRQRELFEELKDQVGRYNEQFFPDKRPIPLRRDTPPPPQVESA